MTEANVDLHFNLNVKTVINVTQCVSNNMLKNKVKGSIVNISSIATRMATMGHLSYGSSKSAVNGLTRTFALELGLKGDSCECSHASSDNDRVRKSCLE